MKGKYKNKKQNKERSSASDKYTNSLSEQNKINLDYDWNTEYGDGDIPEVDK